MMAGTSTGGILSLGATVPDSKNRPKFTAQQLLEIYSTKGNRVFSREIIK